jgi:hypothetical protein
MPKARLAKMTLPDFGMPDIRPEIPPHVYEARLARLRERAEASGYDRLVVYADREHSATISYLTGFDPRFEEAILVVGGATEIRRSWWQRVPRAWQVSRAPEDAAGSSSRT